jgi:O-antigen/teichoic acid export membrane protein
MKCRLVTRRLPIVSDEAVNPGVLVAKVETAPGSEQRIAHEVRRRILGSSAILLLSSAVVGVLNLVYNLTVAHELGAAKFGHATAVYTILMLLSAVTLSFQLLCSKFTARSQSRSQAASIYKFLHRRAWVAGLAIGLVLAGGSSVISGYLNLTTPLYIRLLAIGAVFYIPLGARRGYMQGMYDFSLLALNFVLEGMIKLIGAAVLLSSGYGVEGVVGAMSASVIVGYFAAIPRPHEMPELAPAALEAPTEETVQALTFFIGQVVINNLDIVLVKHFFDDTRAGLYAAIALVGRVVYMLGWSVVSGMFPFSAGMVGKHAEQREGRTMLTTALAMVAGISGTFILAIWLAPRGLWRMLLGPGFPIDGHSPYSSLLVLYALTTAIYCLAVVLMSYEISRKIGNVGWLQLSFSAAIVAGIYLFHSTLASVVTVQLVLMLILLLLVSIPFLREPSRQALALDSLAVQSNRLKKIRRVSENEVIAEFLRGEFYHDVFQHYRKGFSVLVNHPDLTNERENALRRALLFRRRGRLWRELPAGTEWWEVELGPYEMLRTRVFPRNQWLRYGAPGFLLADTVGRLRSRIVSGSSDPFIEKLRSLGSEMETHPERSAVILITLDESSPLTIIEGNHRMTAAGLISFERLNRHFRFLCGFSPRMTECCWYQTDVSTLWRYAKNTLAYYLRDRRKFAAEIWQSGGGAEREKPSRVNIA